MKGKRVLSLALAALMTLSLLVVPAAAVSFTDMTNHWAKDDVEYLATQGVVKGTSATTFAPDRRCRLFHDVSEFSRQHHTALARHQIHLNL